MTTLCGSYDDSRELAVGLYDHLTSRPRYRLVRALGGPYLTLDNCYRLIHKFADRSDERVTKAATTCRANAGIGAPDWGRFERQQLREIELDLQETRLPIITTWLLGWVIRTAAVWLLRKLIERLSK